MVGVIAQIEQQGRTVSAAQHSQLEREVLNGLIEREVVLQFAKTNALAQVDDKVKTQLDRARIAAGGEDVLQKSLQEVGVSRAEFEQRTRENVMVAEALRRVVESRITVTPEEVREFYQANTARIKQPELVRASHILVRVDPAASEEIKQACRTKINAARSLVLAGESFADIARKVSDDPQTARNGGDLGYFPRGTTERTFGPDFEKAAFSLGTNQVSEVITTQLGYHVLMVTDRKPEKQLSFEEAKADLERLLRQQKSGNVIRQFIKELREKTKIEILLPSPPSEATNAPPAAAVKP